MVTHKSVYNTCDGVHDATRPLDQGEFTVNEVTPQETITVVCRASKRNLELTREYIRRVWARTGASESLRLASNHPDTVSLTSLRSLQRELETSSDISVSSFGTPTLGTSIVLSILNRGNQAPRLFGFGPFSPDGYGLGYIIKDDELSVCVSPKRTFLVVCDTFAVASGLRQLLPGLRFNALDLCLHILYLQHQELPWTSDLSMAQSSPLSALPRVPHSRAPLATQEKRIPCRGDRASKVS
ncbi:hypothetical protein EDB86DRAFT_3075898 [Lactarius hatsudake]|nr:hypothetical protein EDB86DRAFT_3075898 [Lactarius hatsudake]